MQTFTLLPHFLDSCKPVALSEGLVCPFLAGACGVISVIHFYTDPGYEGMRAEMSSHYLSYQRGLKQVSEIGRQISDLLHL